MSRSNVVSLRPGIERFGEALFMNAGVAGAHASLVAVCWALTNHFSGRGFYPVLVVMVALATTGLLVYVAGAGVEVIRSPRGRELGRSRRAAFLLVPILTTLLVAAVVYLLAQRVFFGG